MESSSFANASAASTSSSSSPSLSGKRSRDPEDEVYLDNFHSHKRYLGEIMASSLNGLTVRDQLPLPDNLMKSPVRFPRSSYGEVSDVECRVEMNDPMNSSDSNDPMMKGRNSAH